MTRFKTILTVSLLPLSAFAQNKKQPWSAHTVHSTSRPHPAQITAKEYISTPAPEDADVIFDGSSTDALTLPWEIVDGALIATDLGDNKTKKSYSDCHVHIEWRVPKDREIDGQKGGNSGLFLMGLYEIQIQESHTNVTYADGQAAAIYGQTPPLINPARPQGEWQSYDIIFKAPIYKNNKVQTPAHVTVIFNGVTVQNNQVLYGPTKHKVVTKYPKKHPSKAPISLQWHNDPIEFKNFWVRDLTPTSN